MKDELVVGDKVRVKGERTRGEIVGFGESKYHMQFAKVYTKKGLHCILLGRLEKVVTK